MQDIKKREIKMQEKRKNTPRRDFIKEICSWRPVTFYKIDNLISRYPDTSRINKIIGHKESLEQKDSMLKYGLSYDNAETFFSQMQKLFRSIPLENTLLLSGCENAEYADQSMGAKNTYLSYSIINSENILYTILTNLSTNIMSSISAIQSENVYRSHNIVKSYSIFYSKHIDNSSDLRFCTNMIGCKDCLFSQNLENQSYYINNKQLGKEEYRKEKQRLLSDKKSFITYFNNMSPDNTVSVSENVTGSYITDCSNMKNGYYVQATHNSNNVMFIAGEEGCKNFYDTYAAAGLSGSDSYYGIMGCTGGDNVYNSIIIPRCKNTYYSHGMEGCSYCLGCVGLVNKSFCIFNKQYTKEERFKIANEIFSQMDAEGVLGDFFPGSMNPFYFNDTAAYLIDDSFTKKETEEEGYLRREEEIKVDIPEGQETIKTAELNQYQGFDLEGKRTIDQSILKKVIIDEKGNSYRIIKMEYDFLVKHGLPLPELHRLDRIKLGFKFEDNKNSN